MIVTSYNRVLGKSLESPTYIRAKDCLKEFESGGEYKDTILEIRELAKDKEANKERITELKTTLPVAYFCGKFKDNPVKKNFIEHSGLLILDFDDTDTVKLKEQFKKRPFTYSCFDSPSGNNKSLKVLLRIPVVKNEKEYQIYFDFFLSKLPQLDKSGRNINRACFKSYDPEIYINENATEFELPKGYFFTMSHPDQRLIAVCDKILKSPRGESHMAVLAAAYTAGGLVAAGLIPESVAIKALEDAADARRPKEQRDSRAAIQSAFAEGKSKPLYDDDSISFAVKKFDKPKPRKIDVNSFLVSDDEMDDEIEDFYEDRKIYGRGIGNKNFDHFWKYRDNAFYFIISSKGHGKTTTVLFLLLLDAIKNNKRYIIALFENTASSGRNILISFYLDRFAKGVYKNDRAEFEAAKKVISKHFTFINPHKSDGELYFNDVLEVAYQINKENKHNAVFIDPWNSIPFPLDVKNEYRYVMDCAAKCKRFSSNVMSLYLTGHPNSSKQREGGAPKDTNAEMGAVFPNKADVTATLYRDVYGEDEAKYITDLRVTKVRDKELYGGDENLDNFPIRLIFDRNGYGFNLSCPYPNTSGYALMEKIKVK